MQVTIVANKRAQGVDSALPSILAALAEIGVQCILPPPDLDFLSEEMDAYIAQGDVVVALGGDGTMIHTAKRAAAYGKAVLGINCGRLGFMAGIERHELEHLKRLLDGQYTVEKRMMLDVSVVRDGRTITERTALNESVVSRGMLSRMLRLEVQNGEKTVICYQADGVILSTPTGSTAYSLSAGGPIIDPALNCILMTPVCPHSLHARSYIFDQSARLEVRVFEEAALLTIDGEETIELQPGDAVVVKDAAQEAQLIKLKPMRFYDVLNEKLMNRK